MATELPVTIVEPDGFFAKHQADLARRAKERDERCSPDLRLQLCNANTATEYEMKKDVFRWSISATIYVPSDEFGRAIVAHM